MPQEGGHVREEEKTEDVPFSDVEDRPGDMGRNAAETELVVSGLNRFHQQITEMAWNRKRQACTDRAGDVVSHKLATEKLQRASAMLKDLGRVSQEWEKAFDEARLNSYQAGVLLKKAIQQGHAVAYKDEATGMAMDGDEEYRFCLSALNLARHNVNFVSGRVEALKSTMTKQENVVTAMEAKLKEVEDATNSKGKSLKSDVLEMDAVLKFMGAVRKEVGAR